MTKHGARLVVLDYQPRAVMRAQERAQEHTRARLADLDGDRQEWEVRIMSGFLYFGLGGQPESGPARHSRTHTPDAYARHLRTWFTLIDRWIAACEELATAGYPCAIDPPDLPYLVAPYCGD